MAAASDVSTRAALTCLPDPVVHLGPHQESRIQSHTGTAQSGEHCAAHVETKEETGSNEMLQ